MKRDTAAAYLNAFDDDIIEYHGIAYDEPHRIKQYKDRDVRYPLFDWGVSERDALAYCYDHRFTWGGLYEKMSRVSCYLCPLQPNNELEIVFNEYPDLWQEMHDLDKLSHRRFKANCTLTELDTRFHNNKKQLAFAFAS